MDHHEHKFHHALETKDEQQPGTRSELNTQGNSSGIIDDFSVSGPTAVTQQPPAYTEH